MTIRGIRGAITVDHDEKEEIKSATLGLFQEILVKNELSPLDISCVFITATSDLTSVFPAEAIREREDFRYIPVICAQEMEVQRAMPRCIRMLVLAMTELAPQEIHHVYLKEARNLRRDLLKERETL
ncbi:MAG: chorismate mutase [Candidatus Caldatribacteriaceae bacterium]